MLFDWVRVEYSALTAETVNVFASDDALARVTPRLTLDDAGSQRANLQDEKALVRAAEGIERAKQKLEAARASRSSDRRIDDVRVLVEHFRETAPGGDLETLLMEAEIELSRNAPDLGRLATIEADLLRRRHPRLTELP